MQGQSDTSLEISRFWQEYLSTLPESDHENRKIPEAWGFGDSPEMADELGALVVAGTKTATASLLWEYEAEGSEIPKPGDLSIILDGRGLPICLIETVEVEINLFNQVEDRFAYDEGEGDRTLNYWRDGHWRFFTRSCQAIGRELAQDMPVVCERFKLVYLPA
ncbi:MAG: ASCH domain-containing protein [Chloroflexi bacterium]|nr:ASCH domain-containing protein [Chloroflexota bacterium]